MKILCLTTVLCALSTMVPGASFRDDFVVVFIDAESEAKLGQFPLDRAILAKGVRQAGNLGAKGVVMKFFFDQPKSEASDLSLEQALTSTPVLLQARMDDSRANPHALPDRFTFPQLKARTQVSGTSGWIPLPRFSEKAAGVGFVDFASTKVPLLESYQGRTVKSLVLCCIELATGKTASIEPEQKVAFGGDGLSLDARNCIQAKLPLKDDLDYIPFHKFLAGDVPMNEIQGKVVILGYDGPQMHSISTGIGKVRAHRLFVYLLRSIYERVGT